MKIYIVQASWYDDSYEETHQCILGTFSSAESARHYIDVFPEVNEAASRRVSELLEKRKYKRENGQVIDPNDKEPMDAFMAYICFDGAEYDEVDFWVEEYELQE